MRRTLDGAHHLSHFVRLHIVTEVEENLVRTDDAQRSLGLLVRERKDAARELGNGG